VLGEIIAGQPVRHE